MEAIRELAAKEWKDRVTGERPGANLGRVESGLGEAVASPLLAVNSERVSEGMVQGAAAAGALRACLEDGERCEADLEWTLLVAVCVWAAVRCDRLAALCSDVFKPPAMTNPSSFDAAAD